MSTFDRGLWTGVVTGMGIGVIAGALHVEDSASKLIGLLAGAITLGVGLGLVWRAMQRGDA